MSVSRVFDDNVANYFSAAGKNAIVPAAMTVCAWVELPSFSGVNTIFGGRKNNGGSTGDSGFQFEIVGNTPSDIGLGMRWNSNGSLWLSQKNIYTVIELNKPCFVAITVTRNFPSSPTMTFFAAQKPVDLASFGSDTSGGPFFSDNADALYLGAANFAGTPTDPFNGKLQRLGLWNVILTLQQLKDVAVCGASPEPLTPNCYFFYDFTGVDPELNTGDLVTFPGGNAAVVGTLVTATKICSSVAKRLNLPAPQVASPNSMLGGAGGGAGGGVGVPGQLYDTQFPAQDVEKARELYEQPEMRANRKTLKSRKSPRYYSLHHLATTIERRRK